VAVKKKNGFRLDQCARVISRVLFQGCCFKGVVSRVLFQVDQRDDISKPYRFRCRKPANMIPATKARVMSDGNNATQPFNINQTGDWFSIAFALAYTQESR
jgi:hypothetical protein